MSKIVVVFSSPRINGNSCTLGKTVMDGAMGLSTNVIKVFRLNSMYSMRGCQNCDRCINEARCYIEDDLTEVLNEIETCDSLVLAVLLYFSGPCGPFKIFQDRMYSHMNGDLTPRYSGKKLVLIMTHDDPKYDARAKSLEEYMVSMFKDNLGYEIVGAINYTCNREKDAVIHDPEVLEKARSFGKLL